MAGTELATRDPQTERNPIDRFIADDRSPPHNQTTPPPPPYDLTFHRSADRH